MSDHRVLDVLLESHSRSTRTLTELVLAQLAALWAGVDKMKPEGGAWYDGDLLRAASAQAAMIMQDGIAEYRTQTEAYQAQLFDVLEIEWPQELETVRSWEYEREDRAGVLIDEVAERPAEQRRYAKSVGKSDEEALEAAIERAEVIADTDLHDAGRERVSDIYRAAKTVTGYRRIIRPELSTSGTCGLCAAASNQRYTVEELMPIHDRCKCETMPITEDEDPGGVINRSDLNKLYEAAGSTLAQDLKRVRITIDEHGELGPRMTSGGVLIPDGTTRKRRAQPKKQSTKTRTKTSGSGESQDEKDARLAKREQQAQMLKDSLENLKIRASKGEEGLEEAIRYQNERISRLSSEIWDLRWGR